MQVVHRPHLEPHCNLLTLTALNILIKWSLLSLALSSCLSHRCINPVSYIISSFDFLIHVKVHTSNTDPWIASHTCSFAIVPTHDKWHLPEIWRSSFIYPLPHPHNMSSLCHADYTSKMYKSHLFFSDLDHHQTNEFLDIRTKCHPHTCFHFLAPLICCLIVSLSDHPVTSCSTSKF
jgi:hypothetical protein